MKKLMIRKAVCALATVLFLTSALAAFAADICSGDTPVSDTALTYKLVDGKDLSRRDYSQDAKSAAGIQKVFTSATPVNGACGTYALSFQYLMERVGVPCININGDNHAWTMVYIDGKWLNCDPTNSKKTNDGPLKDTIRYKPYDPQRLEFAKEIVVPGSTK